MIGGCAQCTGSPGSLDSLLEPFLEFNQTINDDLASVCGMRYAEFASATVLRQ